MPAAEPRYCVAQVTEEERDAWRDWCEAHDINRTALCEVIAVWMAETNGQDLPPLITRWVQEAKDLAKQRNRRG